MTGRAGGRLGGELVVVLAGTGVAAGSLIGWWVGRRTCCWGGTAVEACTRSVGGATTSCWAETGRAWLRDRRREE